MSSKRTMHRKRVHGTLGHVINQSILPTDELDILHVDAHSHIDKYTADDIDIVLDEIDQHRILTLGVSVDPTAYRRTLEIAHRCAYIVPSFGIHPWEAPHFVHDLDSLAELTTSSPTIGEIGLDHRFVTDPAAHRAQASVFSTMLDCAETAHKLINVHSAGAEQAILEMLRFRNLEHVILHWYSGPLDTLHALLDCGYHVTIGAAVLHDDHIRGIARYIPDDRILTETDNPGGERFLTGRTGRPNLITQIEEAIAHIRATDIDELRTLIKRNALRLIKSEHPQPRGDMPAAESH